MFFYAAVSTAALSVVKWDMVGCLGMINRMGSGKTQLFLEVTEDNHIGSLDIRSQTEIWIRFLSDSSQYPFNEGEAKGKVVPALHLKAYWGAEV
jgi:hypothetical protein